MDEITYLSNFSRLLIASVFFFSFSGKVKDITSFEATIATFGMLSTRRISLSARLLLAAEISVVASLVVGDLFQRIGFLLGLGLLTIFTFALTIKLGQNRSISCNCFGVNAQRLTYYDVGRNVILGIFCVIGVLTTNGAYHLTQTVDVALLSLMVISVAVILMNFANVVRTLLHPFKVR